MHAKNCTQRFYILKEQIEQLEHDLEFILHPLLQAVAEEQLGKLYAEMDDVVMEAEGFVAYD